MASTYSGNLAIELIGTGDQAGTWGNTTNTNLGTTLEQAIVGTANVTMTSATNTAITIAQNNTFQAARSVRLNLVGTITTTPYLYVPAITKPYIINNGLANSVIVSNGSNGAATGTSFTVPAGKSVTIYNDGINIAQATNYIDSFSTSNLTQIVNTTSNAAYHTWGNGTFTFAALGGYTDNVSAGHIEFYTANAGTLTENFRISNTGAFGLVGTNYGTSGQVLTSSGANAAPTWSTPSSGVTTGKAIAMALIFGF
jgi:hypothetical protein